MGEFVVAEELREAWLHRAIVLLRPLFDAEGLEVPQVRISVGFPGGRRKSKNTIGQCWPTIASADRVGQVFIHPVLDDVEEILGVIMHELVHLIDDCKSGHKGDFTKMIRALGLKGKPTATIVGPELSERLEPIVEALGVYPHSKLGSMDPGVGPKKQATRQLKIECPSCGYIARTTRMWLDIGLPTCPCGSEMEEV